VTGQENLASRGKKRVRYAGQAAPTEHAREEPKTKTRPLKTGPGGGCADSEQNTPHSGRKRAASRQIRMATSFKNLKGGAGKSNKGGRASWGGEKTKEKKKNPGYLKIPTGGKRLGWPTQLKQTSG